jgi:purine nucleosidase
MSQTSRFPRRTFLKASAALTAGALFNPLVQAANERRTVIFDCDPGQDDAIAILFALGARDRLDVRALVAVAGNVPLNLTERNARIIRDWAGQTKTLPVYAGCPRPLMRPLITVNATSVRFERK